MCLVLEPVNLIVKAIFPLKGDSGYKDPCSFTLFSYLSIAKQEDNMFGSVCPSINSSNMYVEGLEVKTWPWCIKGSITLLLPYLYRRRRQWNWHCVLSRNRCMFNTNSALFVKCLTQLINDQSLEVNNFDTVRRIEIYCFMLLFQCWNRKRQRHTACGYQCESPGICVLCSLQDIQLCLSYRCH